MDEVIGGNYYPNALRARTTTDMLIGSVSQVALNHMSLLAVDAIQNVCNSKNGKGLVGMLTQLISNSLARVSIRVLERFGKGNLQAQISFKDKLQIQGSVHIRLGDRSTWFHWYR